MSGGDTIMHYQKAKKLTPETSNEELREIYASWRHSYDKVSAYNHIVDTLHSTIAQYDKNAPQKVIIP
jgi:hypothetical protein